MEVVYHPNGYSTPTQGRLSAALAYAGRGYPVFPCRPGGKEPLIRRGHGFLDATTDASRITAWWERYPNANIGIPTGKASGLLVLDEDRTGALSELPGVLPKTTTARTGGGGLHMLYRYPAGEVILNSAGKLGAGIDVRGEGGYVIAPPSRTTGPYEWIERLPRADPPAWLVEALRKPPARPERSKGERGPTPILAAGEKIPDGCRNSTLTSLAGQLHDGTRTLEQLTTDLLGINASRCAPPLPEGEVEKVAASIFKREPAKPSRDVTPEVLEKLGGIEGAHLWGRTWKGSKWKTPRSVMAVLIKEARRHGEKTADGVRVSISVRMLALASGVAKSAITRNNGALDKLKDEGIIRSVEHSGSKSGAFILIQPGRAKLTHSSTGGAAAISGSTLRAPLAAPRLRYTKPIYEPVDRVAVRVGTVLRLGKSAEAVLDTLERVGEWMPVEDLADELGLKRSRDLRRRALKRLEDASVVEWSGDSVRLRLDWASALDRRREDDHEIADYERDEKKYAKESRDYRNKLDARKLHRVGVSLEEIAATLEIGTEDVRRLLNIERPAEPEPAPVEPDGFIEDLERVEDPKPAPVEEEILAEPAPLSPLAVAVWIYLERNPRDAHQPAGWIGNTLWTYELHPKLDDSPAQTRAAIEELGGDAYLRDLKRVAA